MLCHGFLSIFSLKKYFHFRSLQPKSTADKKNQFCYQADKAQLLAALVINFSSFISCGQKRWKGFFLDILPCRVLNYFTSINQVELCSNSSSRRIFIHTSGKSV